MAFRVTMPRLGWTAEKGSVVQWLKEEGQIVKAGEPLLSVESDKAIQEVEAVESGTLRFPAGTPGLGEEVVIGTLLAYLLNAGEELPTPQPAESGGDVSPIAPTGRDVGPVVAQRPHHARPGRRRPCISPRALRVAREIGVDWAMVDGSGKSGRIVERDVRSARSKHGTPAEGAYTALTLRAEADATSLVGYRDRLATFWRQKNQDEPSLLGLMLKLCASALIRYPTLNGKRRAAEARHPSAVHIRIMSASNHGTFAPVMSDVQRKTIAQISQELRNLVLDSHAPPTAEQTETGTFSVFEGLSQSIDEIIPPLPARHLAGLGIGAIRKRNTGGYVVSLCLTYDYRHDREGAAAGFLNAVRDCIEQPHLWLAG